MDYASTGIERSSIMLTVQHKFHQCMYEKCNAWLLDMGLDVLLTRYCGRSLQAFLQSQGPTLDPGKKLQ